MVIRYRANEPSVAAETIDGEAVIVNLRSGEYFSASGSGCQVWDWLCQGASVEEIARGLVARYAVQESIAAGAVENFVSDLLAHELLREWPEADPRAVPAAVPSPQETARSEWTLPKLDVYSDMKDLLLLDPIHEVDEAGWPIAKQRAAPSE
jgi:hypothetical protein